MSRLPSGKRTPSISSMRSQSSLARRSPRVTMPTSARLSHPSFLSRISWAMRVMARLMAVSSMMIAFGVFSHGPLLSPAGPENGAQKMSCPRAARHRQDTPRPNGGAMFPCGISYTLKGKLDYTRFCNRQTAIVRLHSEATTRPGLGLRSTLAPLQNPPCARGRSARP